MLVGHKDASGMGHRVSFKALPAPQHYLCAPQKSKDLTSLQKSLARLGLSDHNVLFEIAHFFTYQHREKYFCFVCVGILPTLFWHFPSHVSPYFNTNTHILYTYMYIYKKLLNRKIILLSSLKRIYTVYVQKQKACCCFTACYLC